MGLTSALRGVGLSFLLVGTFLGCGNASYETSPAELPAMDSESHFVSHQVEQNIAQAADDLPEVDAQRLSRKIIYQAEIRLIVKDLDQSVSQLSELLEVNQGYVSSSSIDGDRGIERTSKWTVRVPVENFNRFREALLKLGEIEQNSLTSEDITGDFYDLKQRIANARQNEARMLEHLKSNTKNLPEILTIEKELDRVRGEIERMQGRLKLMSDLSAMTTVNISMREEDEYTPTAPPTFSAVVSRTFQASLGGLTELGKAIVLLAVGISPWLPLLLVILLVLRFVHRRMKNQSVDAMMQNHANS